MEPISVLIALAPHIEKWITGNDEITKRVVDVAQKLTGSETPEGAVEALRANPDLVIQYQQALAGISAELEKAYLADTANARQREIDVSTNEHVPIINKIIVPVLALIVVIGGGAMLYTSSEADVRTASSNLIMLVLGYYFGTSLGSKRKDDIINKQGYKS